MCIKCNDNGSDGDNADNKGAIGKTLQIKRHRAHPMFWSIWQIHHQCTCATQGCGSGTSRGTYL